MSRPKPAQRLLAYYRRLFYRYGSQHWWPGDGPFEIITGAILTQNTAWRNVEKAIRSLRKSGVLTPKGIRRLSKAKLARLIRFSGTFNLKAERLKAFTRFLFDAYDGNLKRMFMEDPRVLREKLLGVKGIGPETADSILLYAGGLPFFVIDAYTRRVFSRHGWMNPNQSYHGLQTKFTRALPKDPGLYNEFHALIVHVAKDYCGPEPDCADCPLEPLLPRNGPIHLIDKKG